MRLENPEDSFMSDISVELEMDSYSASKAYKMDFSPNNLQDINSYFNDFNETDKIEIESNFPTQTRDSQSLISIPQENIPNEK